MTGCWPGQGEFLTELRPTVACFVRFGGLDYDADPAAGAKLDRYIRWVQSRGRPQRAAPCSTSRWAIKAATSTPPGARLAAHEDDARRATAAAQELRHPPPDLAFIGPVQIGLSQGVVRTGAVWRPRAAAAYGALGDEVNLAARLMSAAAPGQVLASARVAQATAARFAWIALPALQVKGKRDAGGRLWPAPGRSRVRRARAGRTAHQRPLVGRAGGAGADRRPAWRRARQGQGQVLGAQRRGGHGQEPAGGRHGARGARRAGWLVYGGAAAILRHQHGLPGLAADLAGLLRPRRRRRPAGTQAR